MVPLHKEHQNVRNRVRQQGFLRAINLGLCEMLPRVYYFEFFPDFDFITRLKVNVVFAQYEMKFMKMEKKLCWGFCERNVLTMQNLRYPVLDSKLIFSRIIFKKLKVLFKEEKKLRIIVADGKQ